MRRRVLVSACLLGLCCRYDGQGKPYPGMEALLERYEVIPVCPEQLGGLPTPRPAAERRGEAVVTAEGGDVTKAYRRGAFETVHLARLYGCAVAVLKERSPSCGHGAIYDGTFTHTLTGGDGVTAAELQKDGVRVLGESEIAELFT